MIYDFDSISIESLAGKSENQLASIAEMHPDEEVASEAMRLLRTKYDDTYFWCSDCDGLVCKVSDCCLNMKTETNE